MIDDPADKAGTVKAGGRAGTAPHIGESQILFRLCQHSGKLFIFQGFRWYIIVQVILTSHGIGIFALGEQVRPVALGGDIHSVHGHLIFIHDVDRQVGQVEVFQGHIADIVVIGDFHLVVIFFGRGLPGLRVSNFAGADPVLGAVAGLHHHFLGEDVLAVKERLQSALHLGERPLALMERTQEGKQYIGIMLDPVQIKVVLVIIVGAFVGIKIVLELRLQTAVGGLGPQHIPIFARVGAGPDSPGPGVPQHHQRGRAGLHHKNKQDADKGDQ